MPSPRPVSLIITHFQLNTRPLLFAVCARLQGHPQSHRSSTDGPATPATTRYSVPAAYARNYNTSSQGSVAAPHSTKRKDLCTRRACFTRVSSANPLSTLTLNIVRTHTHLSSQLLSLGARTGILHSLSNGDDGTTPTLSDRFQLGGPTNLRMFRANSLGPRDDGAPFFFCFSHMVR